MFLAALLLGGCTLMPATRSEESAAEPTPTPIPTAQIAVKPTYRVQRGDVVMNTMFSGRISPELEEALYFRRDGRIRSVFFKRNDLVQPVSYTHLDVYKRQLLHQVVALEKDGADATIPAKVEGFLHLWRDAS